MDGQSLTQELADILREDRTTSGFLRKQASYRWLYEAAIELTRRTQSVGTYTTLTTVANQRNYTLPANFLWVYLKNQRNEYFLKYNDGTNDYFITWKDYDAIIAANQTTSVSIPSRFCITDYQQVAALITGTATSDGTLSNEESYLIDSTAPFENVSIGDDVHNTTSSSDGIVIWASSSSQILTALFSSTSASDYWATSDAYVIVPQGRQQIYLDPPPSTSGHTIRVEYIAKPTPVYSPYRQYRFNDNLNAALVRYAAWLYKYRDREPNYGDGFFKYFEMECAKAVKQSGRTLNRSSFKVNFTKRSFSNRSYR